MKTKPTILITGANGYIGREVLKLLVKHRDNLQKIIALDIRETPLENRPSEVEFFCEDIRSPELSALFQKYQVNIVVHLAAIVTPGRKSNREFEYSVDVIGTLNVLKACNLSGVQKIIVTSSGAAYGYHPDNPEWLVETDPIRGNQEFAYSYHKRLVEEMLAEYRMKHPDLQQLIFRPGTVLGAHVNNQITNLFEKKIIPGLRGATSPFVLVWDQDVAHCIIKGIFENKTGIYNLAGDGALPLPEMAKIMKKPYVALPVSLVKPVLWALKKLRLTQYGPEQLNFLRYRPVLSNRKLKEEFGYIPRLTTRQVFEYYLAAKKILPPAEKN